MGRNLIRRLRQEGIDVVALARSTKAASTVSSLGAEPCRGGLEDVDAMTHGMNGCDTVFHAAAKVDEWGALEDYNKINIQGTQFALSAAAAAKVGCFVHVGTEAVFLDGRSDLSHLDEKSSVPNKPLPRYPASKAAAEALVLAANSNLMRTVCVRPRLIWGNDDTSVLPILIDAVKTGRWMWIDHGRELTSTTHVNNVCEGLLLAARRGIGGTAYFISDGNPIAYREFLPWLLATQDVQMPEKSIPYWLARSFASIAEGAWNVLGLKGAPPANRTAVELVGRSVVVSHEKVAHELGYAPIISREEGLAQLLVSQS